jgi:hypothetical protein
MIRAYWEMVTFPLVELVVGTYDLGQGQINLV